MAKIPIKCDICKSLSTDNNLVRLYHNKWLCESCFQKAYSETNSNPPSENNPCTFMEAKKELSANVLVIQPLEAFTTFNCFLCGVEQKCSMHSFVIPICNECVKTLQELVNEKKQKMREDNARTK